MLDDTRSMVTRTKKPCGSLSSRLCLWIPEMCECQPQRDIDLVSTSAHRGLTPSHLTLHQWETSSPNYKNPTVEILRKINASHAANKTVSAATHTHPGVFSPLAPPHLAGQHPAHICFSAALLSRFLDGGCGGGEEKEEGEEERGGGLDGEGASVLTCQ